MHAYVNIALRAARKADVQRAQKIPQGILVIHEFLGVIDQGENNPGHPLTHQLQALYQLQYGRARG